VFGEKQANVVCMSMWCLINML